LVVTKTVKQLFLVFNVYCSKGPYTGPLHVLAYGLAWHILVSVYLVAFSLSTL